MGAAARMWRFSPQLFSSETTRPKETAVVPPGEAA